MFITYGDAFLATPSSYDELYYDLIRTYNVYENLYTLGVYFWICYSTLAIIANLTKIWVIALSMSTEGILVFDTFLHQKSILLVMIFNKTAIIHI